MMNEQDILYLRELFADLLNYGSEDVLEPIDPLTYRTPEGDSCLHIAAQRGDVRAVKLLLDAGLHVDLLGDMGNTPLHFASKAGHAEVIKLLLLHGALPERKNVFGQKAY